MEFELFELDLSARINMLVSIGVVICGMKLMLFCRSMLRNKVCVWSLTLGSGDTRCLTCAFQWHAVSLTTCVGMIM